jgi:hypothetical protein
MLANMRAVDELPKRLEILKAFSSNATTENLIEILQKELERTNSDHGRREVLAHVLRIAEVEARTKYKFIIDRHLDPTRLANDKLKCDYLSLSSVRAKWGAFLTWIALLFAVAVFGLTISAALLSWRDLSSECLTGMLCAIAAFGLWIPMNVYTEWYLNCRSQGLNHRL